LTEAGVLVITGSRSSGSLEKGHSEGIASDLRDSEAKQREIFGGEISDVHAAVSSNRVCSSSCGADLGNFIGKGFELPELSTGYLVDHVITNDQREAWANAAGTSRGLGVALTQWLAWMVDPGGGHR
jgi:hypothetical protein